LCLDLKLAEKKINKRTKAMIYVPLNGRSGNMQKIIDFCKTNNIFLIEDAAQALGSSWKGRHLGTFGDIGTLSFSVPKIITMGQGGALLTNSEKLYRKIELLKDFGRESGGSDIHNNWGWNFKFTDLQAVIGIEQMKKLEARIKRKKEIYKRYQKAFVNIKELKLLKTNLKDTAPWFIDIYVANPDSLSLYLRELSIGTRRVYPAISSQKIYQDGFKDDDFPVSKEAANQGLWLPSSTKLSNKEVDIITECIAGYYENLRKAKKVVDKMFSLS
jgi:perosamine synthetase